MATLTVRHDSSW